MRAVENGARDFRASPAGIAGERVGDFNLLPNPLALAIRAGTQTQRAPVRREPGPPDLALFPPRLLLSGGRGRLNQRFPEP
jgi:hypothetical protein